MTEKVFAVQWFTDHAAEIVGGKGRFLHMAAESLVTGYN
jgi:hypothetical protein